MPLVGEAKKAYQRRWMASRRTAWFSDKQCVRCGAKQGLELHHSNPAEKLAHSIWSWSLSRRQRELQKCVALCVACHRQVTAAFLKAKQTRALAELRHGTSYAYNMRGCRCESCRAHRRNRHQVAKERMVHMTTL